MHRFICLGVLVGFFSHICRSLCAALLGGLLLAACSSAPPQSTGAPPPPPITTQPEPTEPPTGWDPHDHSYSPTAATRTVTLWVPEANTSAEFTAVEHKGRWLTGGDIVVDAPKDAEASPSGAIVFAKKWPNAVIPYEIDSSLAGNAAAIQNAVSYFNSSTPVRWMPRQADLPSHTHFVRFIAPADAGTCDSQVGIQGGIQYIRLGAWCFDGRRHILHEMAHAAGFWHEQQRPDRDQFIDIVWNNIPEKAQKPNYGIWPGTTAFGGYDFASIMHYPFTVSYDGSSREVIRPRVPVPTGVVPGTGDTFSATDIQSFRALYGPQTTTSALRVGVIDSGGRALVREGALDSPWVELLANAKQIALSGLRIGVVTADGRALVKEGSLDATWVEVATDVKQIVLYDGRIGVVRASGEALVKEGALNANWVSVATDVTQLALSQGRIGSGGRIGVVKSNREVWVKEGAIWAGWVIVDTDATQLTLSGNRVGVVRSNREAWVKEGFLYAGWVVVASDVTQLVLSGHALSTTNRIGVVKSNREAWVKEGSLYAGWVDGMHFDVTHLALSGNRVGVRRTNETALVKEGSLRSVWVTDDTRAKEVVLPN
ncbi:M12 family metallopeptidase [Deinococcus yunweiensis]|uniref:M12 family metallopeptidase n=1 Tax=Deinococcus yunweiensis TaxID=367282 RepID=UPI00398F38E8